MISPAHEVVGAEGKIEIPTMIIHGTDDEVVPYWHGTELYAKAGNPYKVPPVSAPPFIHTYHSSLFLTLRAPFPKVDQPGGGGTQ
jgi:fermentation-respiration switch protein FrsA (DUF1100 family)